MKKIISVIMVLIISVCTLSSVSQVYAKSTDSLKITVKEEYNYSFKVLEIVNKERRKNGLSPLIMDSSLLNSSMLRAAENVIYFSHTRPDGTVCFTANSNMNGENIAAGQSSPEAVMDSWMNSSGHKANILSNYYSAIGIGCVSQNGNYYWVQCFGSSNSSSSCSKPSDTNKKFTINYSDDVINFNPELNVENTEFKTGSKKKLNIYLTNSGFDYFFAEIDNKSATWSSSSDSFAVNNKGIVEALKKGSSTITANLNGVKLTLKLTAKGKTVNKTITDDTSKDDNTQEATKAASYSYSKITSKPKKTFINKSKHNKNSIKLYWKKIKNVAGYQIQYSTKKNMKKAKKSTLYSSGKTKYVIKNTKRNKKYYIRIRTFKYYGNKKVYSKWSKTITVR